MIVFCGVSECPRVAYIFVRVEYTRTCNVRRPHKNNFSFSFSSLFTLYSHRVQDALLRRWLAYRPQAIEWARRMQTSYIRVQGAHHQWDGDCENFAVESFHAAEFFERKTSNSDDYRVMQATTWKIVLSLYHTQSLVISRERIHTR